MAKKQVLPPEEVLDAVIELVEMLLFSLSLQTRAGYKIRKVKAASRLRMIGHIGMTAQVCRWINIELGLGHDRSTIIELGLDHDLAKAIDPDQARIPTIPTTRVGAVIRQFIGSGISYPDRKHEHQGAIRALEPHFARTPRIWEATDTSLGLYFLRPLVAFGARGKIAWFVHNVGQVLDAHLGLWYVRNGHMDPTEGNIRSLVERLERRVRDKTARAYWSRVKLWYLPELTRVYRTPSKALAQ